MSIIGEIYEDEIYKLKEKNNELLKEIIQCLNQVPRTKVNSSRVNDTYELITLIQKEIK